MKYLHRFYNRNEYDNMVKTSPDISLIRSEGNFIVVNHISDNDRKPLIYSARVVNLWNFGYKIKLPYSANAIDEHTSGYKRKNNWEFTSYIRIDVVQPTYLWFNHADQCASIYIDDILVTTHWGGYNAFFVDITNYIHVGRNILKVILNNNTGKTLAPAAGDFNFNATLGEVELLTAPVLPSTDYGYDGFHITSTVSDSSATITIKTSVSSNATIVCKIDDDTYHYTDTQTGSGLITFTTTISNPHLWNGKLDPHLYNVTLEFYSNNALCGIYTRKYGFRYYDYVYNDSNILYNGQPYTGFLLNGQPYFLRGVCMHSDLEGKANALSESDIIHDFEIINEIGCNFIRLAHYPHPKKVYDLCDEYGIIVQTEVPCVNKFRSPDAASDAYPQEYYDHLYIQYGDMVRHHYNHPCIMFWGLFNEATTDDTTWAKNKLEDYRTFIKNIDPERWVGYVVSHSNSNPSSVMGDPNMDWFGGNIYVGWYINKDSNNPTSEINKRIKNIITDLHKPYAYSEYGCGGNQNCHSEIPQTTTEKGNYPRHDIEYMMWLHEGHIAAIKNLPQLLFSAEWQLFDIAVSSRQEGYKVCLDGVNVTDDYNYKYLNDKGLVMRDHVTKKDPFYLYKAWWSSELFVHICGKNYTKNTSRVIKCYTNAGDSASLYVNNTLIETKAVINNIVEFTAYNFTSGDIIQVISSNISDSFIISSNGVKSSINATVSINDWNYADTASEPVITGNSGNGTVTYYYKLTSANDSTYTTVKPSEIGSYTIKAVIEETEYYYGTIVTSTFEILSSIVPINYAEEYLTLEIVSPGSIGIRNNSSVGSKTLSYSINNGAWTSVTTSSESKAVLYINSLSAGDKVRFKGNNDSYAHDNSKFMHFSGGTATFNVYGNIMSMLYEDNFVNQTAFTHNYTFNGLFKDSNCISAENLILPATALRKSCYFEMFESNSLLISAPALPATTLVESCYQNMFKDCTNLTIAPDLPATILFKECYSEMFYRCSSLSYIKMLATDISAEACLYKWTEEVSSTGTFVKSISMTTLPEGNNGIPANWTIQSI